ncbi:DMT family transporter [Kineococcus sp. SYSU DK002]|uniref:DMT family transporter n=1 Tax=Kineococcus sp. SYSU DK002 TaxID=3383123 RepID=UPI003D7E226D
MRSSPWGLLALAVLCEVTATLSLRAATQAPGWYVPVVAGYVGAFALLGAVLRRGMPIGVAYGVWAAAGVVLTAVAGAVLFAEPLTPVMGAGIALIIAGGLLVELGSRPPREPS